MRHDGTGRLTGAARRIGHQIAGLAGGTLLVVGALTAVPGTPQAGAATPTVGFTTPTADGHVYRHGAVPRRVSLSSGIAGTSLSPAPSPSAVSNGAQAAARASGQDVTYGGGLTEGGLVGAGVTTGQPKVYLVFIGGQWGTESTNESGQAVFGNDPDGEAPALQGFYAGLGTDGELWSGIVTQYCDGVAVGSTSCNTLSENIPYPSPGVLAGTWYDNSASATSVTAAGATGNQLAAEAEAAAAHFGNVTQASNRDAQYVIASPTGTNPDGWNDPKNGYCAYHDDTHDPFIDGGGAVAGPIAAFTNLPYVPDAGTACGANLVNSGAGGVLDGATSTASHEYAETLTDQFPEKTPVPGWANAAGNEIADLCDYVSAPSPGAEYDLTLATGTFAVQGLWSDQANSGRGGCVQNAAVDTFPPTVTGFSPAVGPAGAWVTVTGTALNGATRVAFGAAAASIVSDSPGALVAVVPSAATAGPITVTTSAGSAVSHRSFRPEPTVTGFSPSSGARGSIVTITGSGLAAARKVSLHGKKMTVLSDGPTQITALVPTRGVTGPIAVKTKGGISTSPTMFTVT